MKKYVNATTKKHSTPLSKDVDKYQEWIDFDMKRYGKISDITMNKIKDAGFTVTKDQYGDYEVTASCNVEADTVKKGNKWVNRGDTGEEHGEFETKKEADAQRRAMYANGYNGAINAGEQIDDDDDDDLYEQAMAVREPIKRHLDSMFEELGVDENKFPEYYDVVDAIYEFVMYYNSQK